jgi:hypothetical protein
MTTISFSDTLYINNDNELSYSFNNVDWTQIINYPITLIYTGSETGNVYLTSDITFSTSTKYFIIGSANITFDGGNKTVTINSVTNYPGLFQNGTGNEYISYTNGYSNVIIKNIIMECSTSTLSILNGWLTQNYFSNAATNNVLENLSSNGSIGETNRTYASGISGSYSAANNGNLEIKNCHSTGDMIGRFSSGICGLNAGMNGGIVNISNCYSSGNMLSNTNYHSKGGICGGDAGHSGGNVIITNCYSTGNIYSMYSGGICGSGAGNYNGSVIITNCYSTGIISGSHSGGIAGTWFGTCSNNQSSIINCYSRGNVTGTEAGGICGSSIGWTDTTDYSPHIVISNCYSYGEISENCGSILGGHDDIYSYLTSQVTVDISNCYAVNGPFVSPLILAGINFNYTNSGFSSGTWNDITASTYLSNAPTYSSTGSLLKQGSIWLDPDSNSLNVPFVFNTDLIGLEETSSTNDYQVTHYCHHNSLYKLGHHTKTHFSMIFGNSRGKKGSQSRIFSHMNKIGKGDHYKNYLIESMGIRNLCKK